MEFRILGTLEVVGEEGRLQLGGPKQHSVLARLILRANRSVPAALLIDQIWGDEPPETARNTLQTYVYRLRKVLGDARIEAGSGGYVLHAEPDEIDAARFEGLVKKAKGSLTSDPTAAVAALDEGLALWRGDALADLAEEPSLGGEIARLEELRLAAIEYRISAELQMGRHSTVVSDLEALTTRYPLRERLWAHLMIALYRAGRPAEAMDAFRRVREVLADELGADPSPELQLLHQRILNQDPGLKAPLTTAPTPAPRSPGGDLEPGAGFAAYRIDRIIGRGGMGVVYLAEHEGLRRKVALKLLAPALAEDPRFRERFVRESRLAASIDHPNVIPIYEAGESDGLLYIAMRYVEGTDLRTLLREKGALDPAVAARIVGQIAAALDAAHEQGLVHRDVKPANVLIAHRRGAEAGTHGYLTDFGLTKRTASDSGVTGTGQFVGTLDYAAPEQFRGEGADTRTDVYSLGCVLFECLTGHAPFMAESDAALMYAHLTDEPPRPSAERPGLPKEIDDVVATAMAKAPEDRFASAGELASRAAAALGHPLEEPSRDRPAPRRRRSRRRRRVAIGAVAAVMTAALVVALLQVVGGEPARASFRPGIAIVDPDTGEPISSIPTSVIRQPATVIHAEGSFWVHNLEPNSFVEIDPRDGEVLTHVPAPFDDVGSFTVDGGTLWVTGPFVSKIDIGLRREVDRFDLHDWTIGVVVAEGSLWVTTPDSAATLRIDPATGEIEHRFADLPGSRFLAYGEGSIWTAGWTRSLEGIRVGGLTPSGGVNRIDPDTDAVTRTPLVLPSACCPVAAGGGFGWTADPTRGVVHKLDPSGGDVVATYPTGPGATVGSIDDGAVWVANSDVGTVSRVDALTGARRTFAFDHPVEGVAAGSGVVMVTLGPGRTYEDVIGGLEGDVAKLLIPLGKLEILDPAVLHSQLGYWVESATCAKLLNYADAPANGEWSLQPEVATSMPDISPDGRTYTFTVRPGYRFSPPSNEPLTAETFRYSIERAISLPTEVGGFGRSVIFDLEGEEAFLAGDADHISGLRADGDTLTIELVAPSGDFLERLAVPIFCPVPTDTPPIPGGGGAYVDYPHRTGLSVPSAGPYYIADYLYNEYTILKRNPNYAGPRPHTFDAIALREGIDPSLAVDLVERGSWDGIVHVVDPLLAPEGPVDDRYGTEGATGEAFRYYATPSPAVGFLAFNASRPPFSDPEVRRAAALAIDRESLAAIWGDEPTDQLLPTVMPGFDEAELYALDGSGVDEARSLMAGRTVTAIMGVFPGNDRSRQEAELVRSNLEPIGITVEIEEINLLSAFREDPGVEIDLMSAGPAELYYPDPATFLYDMLVYWYSPASWLPNGVEEQVVGLAGLAGAERGEEAVALADRLAIDEVPAAAVRSVTIPTFLSPNLGCHVFPPFGFGVDLAALCPIQT